MSKYMFFGINLSVDVEDKDLDMSIDEATKKYKSYIIDEYKVVKEKIDDFAHELSKIYGREVKYILFNEEHKKVFDTSIDKSLDFTVYINHINCVSPLYVVFYAEPDFYQVEDIYSRYCGHVLIEKSIPVSPDIDFDVCLYLIGCQDYLPVFGLSNDE